MFGIGFFELLVIAVLGLLIFGPEKLPDAIKTFAYGLSKAKRAWQSTRRELEQELGMDEIRREIHNAQIMEDLEKLKNKSQGYADQVEEGLKNSIGGTNTEEESENNPKQDSGNDQSTSKE